MIISDSKKFVFFHNPKSAGSTIHHLLIPFQSQRTELNFYESNTVLLKNTKHIIWRGHITFKQLYNLEIYNIIKDYIKFCFVRNPYDRAYSSFLQHKAGICGHRDMKQVLLCQSINLGFNSYVQLFLDKKQIENNVLYHAFIPQHLYMSLNGINTPDFIGYVEQFDSHLRKICDKINIDCNEIVYRNIKNKPKPPSSPHNMQMADYKYLDKFEKQTIVTINELYAKDFELLGYKMLNANDFPDFID